MQASSLLTVTSIRQGISAGLTDSRGSAAMPKREPPKRHLPNGIAWAAQQLGVGYSTMYRMVTRGEVTTVEVSGRRRIPRQRD
jgi:excisionase family DNA binding protein